MTVFEIPIINKKDAAQRKERGTIIEALFADFGLGNGKIFSTDVPAPSMTFVKDGVKVVFGITGIMDNTVLTISTKHDKATMTIGKSLDYEKFKHALVEMYLQEYRLSAKEQADKEAMAQIVKSYSPYARQIVLAANKFGFKAEVHETPVTYDVFIMVDAVRKAVLKFDSDMRFKSVTIFNDAAPIEGFDYAYYETKIAQMKNIEKLSDEISRQLLSPAVDIHSQITAE